MVGILMVPTTIITTSFDDTGYAFILPTLPAVGTNKTEESDSLA
jgi:hypothetical protein